MSTLTAPVNRIANLLERLGVQADNSGVSTGKVWLKGAGAVLESHSPVDGALIGTVRSATQVEYEQVVAIAQKAFAEWRSWPAPKRGEVVRQLGEELYRHRNRRLDEPGPGQLSR